MILIYQRWVILPKVEPGVGVSPIQIIWAENGEGTISKEVLL